MIEVSVAIYCLLFANAMLLAAAGLALMRFQRRCEQYMQFWSSPTGAALADSAPGETAEQQQQAVRLERRIDELQQKLKSVITKQARPELPTTLAKTMDDAVRMARKGASVTDLERSCGLNHGEAQLIWRLHGGANGTPVQEIGNA